MKVVIINGQNHKGSTYKIGRILAEKITNAEDIKEIFLPRDMDEFCHGCTQCFTKDEKLCPHYDKLKPLTKMMDEADVLIFTSPVYVYHVTGSLKAFLDHYGYRWMIHRPEESMFKKQAIAISTAAGAGMKSTCKDILDSCFFWGIGKTYKYGVAVRATKWQEVAENIREDIEKKTTKIAKKVKANYGKIKPSIKTKIFFNVVRKLQEQKAWNKADRDYWQERGWDGKKRPWKN